jgi:hypothetical protein
MHFYRKRGEFHFRPPYRHPYHTSRGGNLLQHLHFLGCDPIYLFGMDFCYEEDHSGVLRGNTFEDHLETTEIFIYRNKISRRQLAGWGEDFMKLYQSIQRTQKETRTILRVGSHGALDEIPFVDYETLERTHGT